MKSLLVASKSARLITSQGILKIRRGEVLEPGYLKRCMYFKQKLLGLWVVLGGGIDSRLRITDIQRPFQAWRLVIVSVKENTVHPRSRHVSSRDWQWLPHWVANKDFSVLGARRVGTVLQPSGSQCARSCGWAWNEDITDHTGKISRLLPCGILFIGQFCKQLPSDQTFKLLKLVGN